MSSIEKQKLKLTQREPGYDYSSASIFIIDDEPVAGKVIEMHLEQAGFDNLHVFSNSVEAIEILSIVRADLILTDVNMPELGGRFLTKLVRDYPHLSETPVVVISSDETEATQNHLRGNGVFEILSKPVENSVLLDTVFNALKLKFKTSSHPDHQVKGTEGQIAKEEKLRSAFKRD